MTDQPSREELRRMLQIGRDQLERGEGIEIDERDLERFFAEIAAEVAADLSRYSDPDRRSSPSR